MSGIVSKNRYDLLGNDDEDGVARPVAPPVQPVDKPVQRSGKRNAGPEAPVKEVPMTSSTSRGGSRGGRGGRRGDIAGNEAAFRDGARAQNQDRPTDEIPRGDRPRGGRGGRGQGFEGRGGRGGRARGTRDDRHSRTGLDHNDHAKQAAHSWGENTAAGELNDEKAGDAIALEEGKAGEDSIVDAPVNADGEAPTTDGPAAEAEVDAEPEDKTKSYITYLAELAEKKLQLGSGTLAPRQANEGSFKKHPEGKTFARDGSEEYFAGSGGKKLRERERKDKNVLVLDHDIQAREREREASSRGGRGGRGGRGRGEGSFRGDGAFRGGEGRGRGGRGRGEGRGEFRGPRGGRGGANAASPNVADESSFPSLGA